MNEKLDEVWLSGDNVSVPLRIRRARAPAIGAKGRMKHDRGGFGVDGNGGERVKPFLVGLTLVDMDLMDDRSCFSCYFS